MLMQMSSAYKFIMVPVWVPLFTDNSDGKVNNLNALLITQQFSVVYSSLSPTDLLAMHPSYYLSVGIMCVSLNFLYLTI